MRSAFNIPASEVINTKPVKATTEESVAQIKNKMEDHQLRTIPLVDEDDNFKGAISYRELIRFVQFNPEITAPERLMHQPPAFKLEDSLVALAELRINSGKKMMVHVQENKLEGVIGEKEFLEALTEVDELKDVSTSQISSRHLVTVEEDEVVDKARHKMLDNNISRLPVIDNKNKLAGIVDSIDILQMVVKRETQSAGGRSGRREGEEVKMAGGGEKQSMSDITVDQLTLSNAVTSQDHMTGLEAAKKLEEGDRDDIIFVENGYPEEIVTLKDLIRNLSKLAQRKTIFVQLTGVDVPEEKAAINRKIRKQLQGSLGRKLNRPQELKLRLRKEDKDGKKNRWELRLQLVSEHGVISVEEEGWELLDTLDEALEQLNSVVRKKHDKRKEHRRN